MVGFVVFFFCIAENGKTSLGPLGDTHGVMGHQYLQKMNSSFAGGVQDTSVWRNEVARSPHGTPGSEYRKDSGE